MDRKPNVLLITADQWRGDCLSAVGHPCVKTPNVDALAAEGVLFRNHFAGAAPCSPARASLYTGLYQMNNRVCRNGSPLDHRFDNVARAGRRAGYDPTMFGYTDIAPDPRQLDPRDPHLQSYEGILPGFTVRELLPEDERPWLSWLRQRGHVSATDRSVHVPEGQVPGSVTNAPPAYSRDETQTAFLTDSFLRWRSEQDRPWFAHISFLRPHPPFVVPEPYNTMFSASDGPAFVGATSRETEMALHPYLAYDLGRQKQGNFLAGAKGKVGDWSEADRRAIRAIYYGMIAEVDAQLGRIWQGLRESGDWENTIIVMTSDHGEMAGDHGAFGKSGFFDASYHIPLVIRDPRREDSRGTVVSHFTAAADVMPTLCEQLEVTPRNHLDGKSLQPFLAGNEPENWRRAAFWEYDFRDVAAQGAEQHFGLPSNACNLAVIRDEAFKYVHFAGMAPLLFDLATDPGETVNLADHPDYLAVRLRYAEALLALKARHLDQTLAYTTLTEQGPAVLDAR